MFLSREKMVIGIVSKVSLLLSAYNVVHTASKVLLYYACVCVCLLFGLSLLRFVLNNKEKGERRERERERGGKLISVLYGRISE